MRSYIIKTLIDRNTFDYFRSRWAAEGGYRQLLIIAVPLIFSSAGFAIQQFVDRMFLAWYSAEAIAATMPAGLINFTTLHLFIGTAGYVSTFVAQYWGAALHNRIGPILWQGFYVAVFLYLENGNNRKYRVLDGWRLDVPLFLRLLRYGLPNGLQYFMSFVGISVFLLLVGRLGTMELAATNIAFNINMLAFMPMTGVGMAIMIMVGQYQGKTRTDLAEKSVYSGFHLTNIYMITLAASYVMIPKLFLWPFTVLADPSSFGQIEEVVVVLLRFIAIYCLFDSLNIVFASGVKGAGDTRFVMAMIFVLSILGLALPTYIALVLLRLGLLAAWTIITIYVIILGFAFFFRFLYGKWKTMLVIDPQDMIKKGL